MSTMKVTASGQISLPADVRRRWQVSRVRVVDHGDHLTIEPIDDDVIAATYGLFATDGPPSDELRAADRADTARREDSRARVRRASTDRRPTR